MNEIPEDEVREERIAVQVTVDAYTPEEQALGWYCYLDAQIFAFTMRVATGELDQAAVAHWL